MATKTRPIRTDKSRDVLRFFIHSRKPVFLGSTGRGAKNFWHPKVYKARSQSIVQPSHHQAQPPQCKIQLVRRPPARQHVVCTFDYSPGVCGCCPDNGSGGQLCPGRNHHSSSIDRVTWRGYHRYPCGAHPVEFKTDGFSCLGRLSGAARSIRAELSSGHRSLDQATHSSRSGLSEPEDCAPGVLTGW